MKKRMMGRLLIATLADTNAIREELEDLKEELAEIKKIAAMTDQDKYNKFWAECIDNLSHVKITVSETGTETNSEDEEQ